MASLDVIIRQMILSAFRSANMSSASPGHVNRFMGVESQGGMDIIGSNEEVNEAIREAVTNITSDPDSAESLAGDLLGAEEKTGKNKTTANLLQTARLGVDPTAALQAYAKKLIPVLMPLLITAGLAELIINVSLSPGGIIDRRLRRYITEEVNGLLDKQTQKNFSIGTRQLTIQSRAGFRNIQGIGSEDNLRQIREGAGSGLRKSNLDYIDMSKGVRDIRE